MNDAELYLHPLCVFFPRITGTEFDALVADIKANGLREPIVLYEGQVLDGGNRYRACLEAGVEPHFIGFTGGDIAAFVLSANLHRRHLAQGQAAAIIAQITNWAEANTRGGRRSTDEVPEIPLKTVADRAKASGTSERTQRTADKVAKTDPELVAKVAQGEISLSTAVEIINEGKPRNERQQEAEQAHEEAFSDFDLVAEVERLTAELQAAQAELEQVKSDSPQGQILKLNRQLASSNSERDKALQDVAYLKKRTKWGETQLKRIARMIGADTDKLEDVADLVEKVVKQAA